jgi:hypothetical protein
MGIMARRRLALRKQQEANGTAKPVEKKVPNPEKPKPTQAPKKRTKEMVPASLLNRSDD